jgi:hypothetical protein
LLSHAEQTLVRSLERAELLRALAAAIELLLRETDEVSEEAGKLEQQLRDLADPALLTPH